MDSRLLGFLLGAAIAGTLVVVHDHRKELEHITMAHRLVKTEADRLKAELQTASKLIAQRTAALDQLASLMKRSTELRQSVAEAQAAADAQLQRLVAEEQAFDRAVAATRQAAVGSELGSMVLADGRLLASVTVKAARPDHLEVIHGSGTARLTKSDLPKQLSERFQLHDPIASAIAAPRALASSASEKAELRGQLDNLSAQIANARAQAAMLLGASRLLEAHAAALPTANKDRASAARAAAELLTKDGLTWEHRLRGMNAAFAALHERME